MYDSDRWMDEDYCDEDCIAGSALNEGCDDEDDEDCEEDFDCDCDGPEDLGWDGGFEA